jgi:hypothetical protein
VIPRKLRVLIFEHLQRLDPILAGEIVKKSPAETLVGQETARIVVKPICTSDYFLVPKEHRFREQEVEELPEGRRGDTPLPETRAEVEDTMEIPRR